jgi:uncharacterized protein
MKVAVTGAGGFLGSALCERLLAAGHSIVRLVRPQTRERESSPQAGVTTAPWDPERGTLLFDALAGVEAAVHLAGESIAGGRWTEARKAAILESRVAGTRTLAAALARLTPPPSTLVCASAIGYYGDRGAELLDEKAAPGHGVLSEVCQAWEAAADPARAAGVRVAHLRFGLVLDPAGGALAKMLPPFRLGVGGRLGSGRQFMSWVSRADVVGAILHAIATPNLEGSVNVVAPGPVTNAEFTRCLSRALGRPAWIPVPATAIRLLLGEMGQELLLSSTRVLPARLRETGYRFQDSELESTLRELLARA